MRRSNLRNFCFGLFFVLSAQFFIGTQGGADPNYVAKRQKASQLFDEGKRLEALPLLEELVQMNPKDDAMLVALAASLVDHAATLTDEAAAGRERLRARDLLNQAWDLGNTSSLAMNLSQLLRQLPASGSIKFSDNPQVERFMEAGEAAFSRRDFDGALKYYSKALEVEPKNSSAALFTGNTYDKQNEFSKAAEWYQRAIELDPNVETPYRYYADLLAKKGEMSKARGMLIQAAVAEPYNQIVWRELHAWATLNNTSLNVVYVSVPRVSKNGETNVELRFRKEATDLAWEAYWTTRSRWQQGEFKKHFPGEKEYRHSLPEESDALLAAAKVLDKLQTDNASVALMNNAPSAMLLLKLYHAGLIEPYVLFSLGDEGIALDYAVFRAKNRKELEEYLDKFVVPSVQ